MAKKKAKWLESPTPELLEMLKEILETEEVDTGKAQKIVDELIERLPAESTDELSVEEAIAKLEETFATGLTAVQEAYKAELDSIGDEEEEEEEVPAPKAAKGKKEKAVETKTAPKNDYTEMSNKNLKVECRARGIKVSKSMEKVDLIKALEADDKN